MGGEMMATSAIRDRLCRGVVIASALVLVACNGLTVDQRGVYTSSASQEITGTVDVADNDALVAVTVNGEEATVDGDRYTIDLPLDGEAIFNAVLVEARYRSGEVIRERRTVVYGDRDHATVLPEGEELDDAVGLRVNESSFTKLGPVIKQLTTLDLRAIAPPGTVLMDKCLQRVIGCTLYVKATTATVPTIRDFDVTLDSHSGDVQAIVRLYDLHLDIDIDARVLGVGVHCDMVVDADRITIDGRYTLRPDPAIGRLDVNLVGAAPAVSLSGVSHDFTGGACSLPLLEQIVSATMGDVQTLMRDNLVRQLGDRDGTGPLDSPVADAIEGALANIHLAGPIGDALGLELRSNLQSIAVDTQGLGFRASGSFTSSGPAPGAPDLTGSVGWGDVLGPIGATSPGGQPFDVAVGASASSFNQLLAGETERGLLNVVVDQLDGQPLTLRRLLDLIGAGGLVPEDMPLVVELRPEVAPVVTPAAGPGGELAELRLAGYRVLLRSPDGKVVLGEIVVDFTTGIDLTFADGGLAFVFAPPAAADLEVTITQNPLALPAAVIELVVEQLTPRVFASLQDALPVFPLPEFVGLSLQPVEVGRLGPGFALFANLAPAG